MMFFKPRMHLILLVGVAVVMLSALQAKAVVVYTEDFEGETVGTGLENMTSPWGIHNLGGAIGGSSIEVQALASLGGDNAADGAAQDTIALYFKEIPTITNAITELSLSWDMIADSKTPALGGGTTNSSFGFHNNDNTDFGCRFCKGMIVHEHRVFDGETGWFLDMTGLAGVTSKHTIGVGGEMEDVEVRANITIDLVNNTIEATLFDGFATISSGVEPFPAGGADVISQLGYVSDARTHTDGLDVDNIVLEYVPEPTSCLLLSLGLVSLLGCSRRNRG